MTVRDLKRKSAYLACAILALLLMGGYTRAPGDDAGQNASGGAVGAEQTEGVDAKLERELEEYIASNYGEKNLRLQVKYEYVGNSEPLAEMFLPAGSDGEDAYRQAFREACRAVNVIAMGAKKASDNKTPVSLATCSFSYSVNNQTPGYVVRIYSEEQDDTSDDVVRRILSTPLSAWMNDADGYGDRTLADVFNKANFYGEKWLLNPSVTSDRDTLAVYWGYVRSGSDRGMLAVLHVLCDEDGGGCTADYVGYISKDEKTVDEASAKDGVDGISRVLTDLCRFAGVTAEP